ncbi:MAG: proline--tRNA ligase [Actinobacteria bacterium]|nr:proline--tRNA ligase [Actinomycetota bacterium]
MRWSQAFIPTLRQDPADAEAASHRLLVRGGFIRQLMAGSYSMLPLGQRVASKIITIIRQELDRIGGQEFLLPVVHPGEVWKRTGRWDDIEGILVKFRDRRGADLLLAITHEEIFALLAGELSSYRELPQLWYHFQTKFRDEPRPKAGLLRVREFTMKDSYSFDIDQEGLDRQFANHHAAYTRIFRRTGLETIPVQASSGVMGGNESVEFRVPSPAGEDFVAVCRGCGYAANVERATSVVAPVEDAPWERPPERLPTPGVHTIADLAAYGEFAAAERQIKTMVYVVGGALTLVLLRGDHEVMEQKLIDGLGNANVRPGHPDEIREALGALPGSLGAVGVTAYPVIADPALRGRRNMITGANEDDWHLRGVDVERDIRVQRWLDVRRVNAGEGCPECGRPLEVVLAIEVGHIFKLGTKYSEAVGARVLDEEGRERPIVMGSYGIGVGRHMAAVVEVHHDEAGICWPVSVAPFEAVVTVVGAEPAAVAAAEGIYRGLQERGVDVLLDDRDERPGVKFTDAELIGIPYRVTVGPRRLAEGLVEVVRRRDRRVEAVPTGEAAAAVAAAVAAERG